jgi:hypothetical protein
LLEEANKSEFGYIGQVKNIKEINLKDASGHQVLAIHQKSMFLILALTFTKENMNQWTWKKCCEESVNILNKAGIKQAKHSQTVIEWCRQFRVKRKFTMVKNIAPKDDGLEVMISSFQSKEFGFGVVVSAEQLKEVNEKRKNKKYKDLRAAAEAGRSKDGFKKPFTTLSFVYTFKYGADSDGYWNYNHMVLQLETVLMRLCTCILSMINCFCLTSQW